MYTKVFAAAVLVITVALGPTKAQVSCPDGFSALDDKCFQFIPEMMTWSEAEANCEAQGGYLAILNDCRLWVDVVKKIQAQGMKDTSFWIGATDQAEEGVWLWLNGENVEMGIPFWGWTTENPQPDDGIDGNCAFLSKDDRHYFHDTVCTGTAGGICQASPTLLLSSDE